MIYRPPTELKIFSGSAHNVLAQRIADYCKIPLGNATVAPAGLKVYTSSAIPGWRNSLLLTTMISGVMFRLPLADDPRNPVGTPVAYFKTVNRYRDVAVAPDGLRFYLATDADGRTVGSAGALTRELANPNAILEFRYAGAA